MTSNQHPNVTSKPGTVVVGARVMSANDELGKIEAVHDDGSLSVKYRYPDPAITYLPVGDGTYSQAPGGPYWPRLLFVLPDTQPVADLASAGKALLENLVQNAQLADLVRMACDLNEAFDEADLWGTREAVAVEAVRGHLRMAQEAALRGLGRRLG